MFKVFMSALVGSHNYNLNIETSDKDYKFFVYPAFEDLYYKREVGKSSTSDVGDSEIHDIRKLPQLWWKANINFIEVLFSQEYKYYEEDNELIAFIKNNRKELAIMNLPYLYDACIGMSIRKQQDMITDSPSRHHNIEKYGYDPKSAYHAIRILDFLPRLINFNLDFGKAIWYDNDSFRREILLKVRYGEYILPQIQEMLVMYTANANYVKSIYKEHSKNTSLKDELDEVIKGQCLRYIRAI